MIYDLYSQQYLVNIYEIYMFEHFQWYYISFKYIYTLLFTSVANILLNFDAIHDVYGVL